jgi:hypothetical protein
MVGGSVVGVMVGGAVVGGSVVGVTVGGPIVGGPVVGGVVVGGAVVGGFTGVDCVVADRLALPGERLPAASTARTEYECVVFGPSPASTKLVPETLKVTLPSRVTT